MADFLHEMCARGSSVQVQAALEAVRLVTAHLHAWGLPGAQVVLDPLLRPHADYYSGVVFQVIFHPWPCYCGAGHGYVCDSGPRLCPQWAASSGDIRMRGLYSGAQCREFGSTR